MFGAFIGCMVGLAVLVVLQRSALRAAASFLLGLGIAAGSWVAFGSGSLGDRAGDCLLAAVLLGVAAITGIAVGKLAVVRRRH
jgi:hypothetical protein